MLFCLPLCITAAHAEEPPAITTAKLSAGDLQAVIRDNAQSRRLLSGVASLVNTKSAPDWNAFDAGEMNANGGLNFEHITSGHKNPHNMFTPREGRFSLSVLADGKSAMLTRRREDEPWQVSSTLKYTLVGPHYVDMDFRCVPHDAARFGAHGYASFFFANYMNDVAATAIHFRGIDASGGPEKWIEADAPPGPKDWVRGGNYRAAAADDLKMDADYTGRMIVWSYDYPRFTKPFYYGRAAHDMVLIMMFNKAHTPDDEVRFALYKYKLPKLPRPAWDFQYIVRGVQAEREYGFKARLVWKKFVSADDCLKEYNSWAIQQDQKVIEPQRHRGHRESRK